MKIKCKKFDGYIFGARQPSMSLTFDLGTDFTEASRKKVLAASQQIRSKENIRADQVNNKDQRISTAKEFIIVLDYINKCSGDQRFSEITARFGGKKAAYFLPTLSHDLVIENLNKILSYLQDDDQEAVDSWLERAVDHGKELGQKFLPMGTNSGNFISSAAKRGIPFHILNRQYVVFGYGTNSLILNSSIIEDESAIGVSMSRNKMLTNRMLRNSGIPVAEQRRVRSLQDCNDFVKNFGFPVVLKPIAEDLGRGVHANIESSNELSECFAEVSRDYKDLIIENHVYGNVYRINTFRGKPIRIVHRQHPEIYGNGQDSIRKIIETENRDPMRSSITSSRKKIKIDKDLIRMIKKEGLTLESVPEDGRVIQVSSGLSGGIAVIPDENLHPENIKVCVDAAETMRVSLSGVDFISEDPTIPWHENGGIVCEVNSQPQLGVTHPEIFDDILYSYFSKLPDVSITVSKKFAKSQAPIFNKNEKSLHLQIHPHDLISNGCPTQYFNSLEIEDDVSPKDQQIIDALIRSVGPVLDH